jgi:hypothetical protein
VIFAFLNLRIVDYFVDFGRDFFKKRLLSVDLVVLNVGFL